MGDNQQLFINVGKSFSLMLGLPRVATWDTNGRPKNARRGTLGFNTETNSLEYFNGSHWLAGTLYLQP